MRKKSNKSIIVNWFLCLCVLFNLSSFSKADAQDVIQVNKQTTKQTIWGFGAAANHPSQDLHNKFTPANQKIILDKLFGTDNDNAGLSIVRLEVNGHRRTDNDLSGREQFTCEPADGVWDWESDQHQRWLSIEASKRSSSVYFMACPWTPPAWMKTNGSPNNGGNLKAEFYDKFANYLKTYVDHYKNIFGIDIRWVSVQNEPSNNTPYASCTYSNQSLDVVTGKVADAIHSLKQNILVGSPEGATRGISAGFMGGMSATTKSKLDFVITHDYGGANNSLAGYGKPVINTEIWSEGGNDMSINDGIRWANAIKDALNRNEPGWLFWWLVDPHGGAQGLISISDNGTYSIPKRLYTVGQFSRFMRNGDVRVEVTSSNGQLSVIATKNASGGASIAVINNSTNAITSTVKGLSSQLLKVYRTSANENLAHLADINVSGNSATVTFAAKSVTTLIESVPECSNNLPTINPIPEKTFDTSDGIQNIALSGISDGDNCTQGVTVTATSSNSAIVSVNSLNHTSCNPTGNLSLTPNAKGCATITVTVTDGGSATCPPASKTMIFTVCVKGAILVPAIIEAENFTAMQGIQVETTTDIGGGQNIGYTDATDYLDYYINVPVSGPYYIDFRVASMVATGKIEIRNEAGIALATLAQGSTGGWQTWVTKTVNINLTAGKQTLKIYYTGAGLNLNWFEVKSDIRVLKTIAVTPATTTLFEGQTQQYTAVGRDQYGDIFPITPRWSEFHGGTIDQEGLYTATTVGGPFTIIASVPSTIDDSELDGTAQVTVKPIPVLTTISLSPTAPTVYVGFPLQITAVGIDQNGNIMPITPVWSSTCWLINQSGEVRCNTPGVCEVCATVGTVSSCIAITAIAAPVLTTVEVTPAKVKLIEGQTQQFTAIGKDQYGAVMSVTPSWEVASGGGGTINQLSGLFTATAQSGPFNILAQCPGSDYYNVIGFAEVTVEPAPQIIRIEAESYTTMFGVQKETTTDEGGGQNVGYIGTGDWMTYLITVPVTGTYKVNFRASGWVTPSGRIALQNAAFTTLTSANVPNGGAASYQKWSTVPGENTFTLQAGTQTIRIYATIGSFNLNWFSIEVAKPGIKIEAESYTSMFGIQTQATTDAGGGLNVGYTEPGDWMNYSVTVPTAGVYTVNFRVASLVATGKIELRNSAGTALASLAQGSTGGWQTWVTKSVTATLPAGLQTLRIYYTGAGLNINWFELVEGGLKSSEIAGENGTISDNEKLEVYPNPVSNELYIQNADQNSTIEVFNLSGKLVLVEKLKADHNALNVSSLKSGIYLLKAIGNDKTQLVKFIKK
jgi:glucuronoarabinoxylan endo-1,4-beta-xylanase